MADGKLEERIEKQIAFIKEIDKVKLILRKTRLICADRHENDAEHSWHLAMMAIVMAEHSNKQIDILRVLKMLLIHDIVEIDTGDIFFFDTKKNHSNSEEELAAANRIFGILPEDQYSEFVEIWQEFEAGETDEAKFAKSIDRFEPVLQNHSNKGGTWAEFKVPYDKVVEKLQAISTGSINIWNYAQKLIQETLGKRFIKR